MEKNKIVELKNISMSFDGEPVLKNLDLSISDGEFVTLLGPSGCGKTTTLRIIGGFITPDSGDVFLTGRGSTTCRRTSAVSTPSFSDTRCSLI